MTLKDRLFTLFDMAAAPSQITDRNGQDAYATTQIARFTSRPEMITTLLGTTSVLGLQVATGIDTSSSLKFLWQSALGYGAYVIAILPSLTTPTPAFIPNIYLDRTRKADPLNPITPNTQAYLMASRDSSLHALKAQFPAWVAMTGAFTLLDAGPIAATASTLLTCRLLSRYWRSHQALEGNWRVLETLPPKQEEKAPARAQAQGASLFAPAP